MNFGSYLKEALKNAGLSRRAFAKKVGYHPSNVDKVAHGKRPPPLKRIPMWAKALGDGVDAARFKELAALEHCPESIQDEYEHMRQALAKRTEVRDKS